MIAKYTVVKLACERNYFIIIYENVNFIMHTFGYVNN